MNRFGCELHVEGLEGQVSVPWVDLGFCGCEWFGSACAEIHTLCIACSRNHSGGDEYVGCGLRVVGLEG